MFRETKPIIFHDARVENKYEHVKLFFSFDEFMTPEHDFHNNNKSFHATTYIFFIFGYREKKTKN